MRGAWLPGTVRNHGPTQDFTPDVSAAPAPAPAAADAEPWWMEAAEWIAPEPADEKAPKVPDPPPLTRGPSPDKPPHPFGSSRVSAPPRRRALAEREAPHVASGTLHADAQDSFEPKLPTVASTDATSSEVQTGPTPAPTFTRTPQAPALPPATAQPQASVAKAATPHARTAREPHAVPEREATPHPAADAIPSKSIPVGTARKLYQTIHAALRRHAPLQSPVTPWPAPQHDAPAPARWTAGAETATVDPALAASALTLEANAPPAATPLRPQRMGKPQEQLHASVDAGAARSTPARAAPFEMAALLAAASPPKQQVYVDRIEVTVQAPPTAALPTAAPQQISANAPAATEERRYRNPWSGYHARRD